MKSSFTVMLGGLLGLIVLMACLNKAMPELDPVTPDLQATAPAATKKNRSEVEKTAEININPDIRLEVGFE